MSHLLSRICHGSICLPRRPIPGRWVDWAQKMICILAEDLHQQILGRSCVERMGNLTGYREQHRREKLFRKGGTCLLHAELPSQCVRGALPLPGGGFPPWPSSTSLSTAEGAGLSLWIRRSECREALSHRLLSTSIHTRERGPMSTTNVGKPSATTNLLSSSSQHKWMWLVA